MARSNVDEQDEYDTILPPVSSRAPPVHALPKWTKPNMGRNDDQEGFFTSFTCGKFMNAKS